MNKLKLMTIVGTRPEIIRLSEVIKKCDIYFDQILIHTGQNYDYCLNQVFFLKTWDCVSLITIWRLRGKIWEKQLGILLINLIN